MGKTKDAMTKLAEDIYLLAKKKLNWWDITQEEINDFVLRSSYSEIESVVLRLCESTDDIALAKPILDNAKRLYSYREFAFGDLLYRVRNRNKEEI